MPAGDVWAEVQYSPIAVDSVSSYPIYVDVASIKTRHVCVNRVLTSVLKLFILTSVPFWKIAGIKRIPISSCVQTGCLDSKKYVGAQPRKYY